MAKKRQVAGRKIDTAEVVRQALEQAESKPLDLETATRNLGWLGHQNPTDEQVVAYAREARLLAVMDRLVPGMNCKGQIGKWDMSSEEAIHSSFENYLSRRLAGQHARWSGRK